MSTSLAAETSSSGLQWGETRDLKLLLLLGTKLECRLRGRTVRDLLIGALLKVRDKEGRIRPLRANRAQREFSRRCGRKNIVLKARQMGITTWVAARFFIATITRRGMLSVQVAHDQKAAEEIFRIVHRFWENLPERLRTGALRRSRANVRQIVFPLLDSEYRVETAADPDAGRGLTIQQLHASEVARWRGDAAQTLAALRAAVPPQGEMVLESTPRGAGGCFYREWRDAGETGAVRHFFPWWWEPAYRSDSPIAESEYTAEERELARRHGLGGCQIAYRRELQSVFGFLAPQEFAETPEKCFLASNHCIFDVAAIERRLGEVTNFERHRGRIPSLLVFYPPLPERRYIAGVDPAGGGSEGDYAVVQIIDRDSGLQCAELRSRLTPEELVQELVPLAVRYNHALLAIERNNHGHAVLAYLQNCKEPLEVFEQKRRQGWLTTAASRPQVVASLAEALRENPELLSSPRLLREMRTFVRHRDGSVSAMAGEHDDCVIAMGIALAVRKEIAAQTGEPQVRFGSLAWKRDEAS